MRKEIRKFYLKNNKLKKKKERRNKIKERNVTQEQINK